MTSESSFPLVFDLDQNRTPAQNRRAVRVFWVFFGGSKFQAQDAFSTHTRNTRLVSPLKSVFYIGWNSRAVRVGAIDRNAVGGVTP